VGSGDGADYVLAELRDSELVVRVQLRSGVYEARLRPPDTPLPPGGDPTRRFDDDRWHKLVVSRQAREVRHCTPLLLLLSVSL